MTVVVAAAVVEVMVAAAVAAELVQDYVVVFSLQMLVPGKKNSSNSLSKGTFVSKHTLLTEPRPRAFCASNYLIKQKTSFVLDKCNSLVFV